jgi:hypothetical protein
MLYIFRTVLVHLQEKILCRASNEKIKSNHKNFVHLVGLYTYCKMMHGAYTYCRMMHGAYIYCRMMHGAYNVKQVYIATFSFFLCPFISVPEIIKHYTDNVEFEGV